jgi:molybdopterin adenylyltransferase
MSTTLDIRAVNISVAKGTPKEPVDAIAIEAIGVLGDAHAGPGLRQVSLLAEESIERFAQVMGRPIRPGEFAENITVRGLDAAQVAPLDRIQFGDVDLEVTQIGKACHGAGCAIFRQVGKCVMPQEGIFARVLRGGTLRAGMSGEHVPRLLRMAIVTLSDRASAGEYEDRSGPRIREVLDAWLATGRRRAEITSTLLPDDAEQLRSHLLAARSAGVDVVLTTGGTGVGARDITPDVAAALCDRQIPGIMEHIRVKYGSQKPQALLSRSIAGVMGGTQVYTMPGSVRAVEEYMAEILKTLEHVLFMIHGLDVH